MHAVLEVGGTHVTAALVDLSAKRVLHSRRVDVDSDAPAEVLLGVFAEAVRGLGPGAAGRPLAVAIPGPFDYERGIGDFEGVAKFGALNGVDVGAALREALGMEVSFLNDVTAYALGQYELLGAPRRLAAITLGTGVGSAFLADGVAVESGADVPPKGWVYLLEHDGEPIEETFSRRALIAGHLGRSGVELDVVEIAALARDDDPAAVATMRSAYSALAETLAPWIERFDTDVVVVGGSIAESWDLVERWFTPALLSRLDRTPQVVRGTGAEDAALIGAAHFAAG